MGCPRRHGRRWGRGIDALQQVHRLVVQRGCVEEARKGWCGTRERGIRRRRAGWSWRLSVRKWQVHWVVGIHGRQITSTAQSYTASYCNSGPFHATSQLQAVAIITGYWANALYLIATADNSITAIVRVLQTSNNNVSCAPSEKKQILAYFSVIFQEISFG